MSIPFKVDFLGKKTPAWLCDLNNSLWNILDGKNFVTEYIPEGNKWILQTVKLSDELEQEVTTLLKNAVPQNITVEYDPFPLDYTRLAYLENSLAPARITVPCDEFYKVVIDVQDLRKQLLKIPDVLDGMGTRNAQYEVIRAGSASWGFWGGTFVTCNPLVRNIVTHMVDNTYNSSGDIYYRLAIKTPTDPQPTPTNRHVSYNKGGYHPADNYNFFYYRKLRIWGANMSTVAGDNKKQLVPAITPDGTMGLFDVLQGGFYTNVVDTSFVAGIDTLAQLYSLLAKLPDKTGQEQGVLQVRLGASLQTDELRAMIDERGEAKNWEITEAPEIEIAS